MSAPHLVKRFTRALWPGAPSASDEAWVATVLDPSELLLFRRLPNHDRRHAIRVARRVEHSLGAPTDERWLTAALLHDVGKYRSGLSVPGRAAATVVAAVARPARLARWAEADGWRGQVGSYARHGEIGAEEIRRAGGRPEAATWSAQHHHPESFATLEIPLDVVQALDAADNA